MFASGLSPFRKSRSLELAELESLYVQRLKVATATMYVIRSCMGDDIHVKIWDFLKVHNKGGQPCPKCGNSISLLTANQRITSYCRSCQPGMLIKN